MNTYILLSTFCTFDRVSRILNQRIYLKRKNENISFERIYIWLRIRNKKKVLKWYYCEIKWRRTSFHNFLIIENAEQFIWEIILKYFLSANFRFCSSISYGQHSNITAQKYFIIWLKWLYKKVVEFAEFSDYAPPRQNNLTKIWKFIANILPQRPFIGDNFDQMNLVLDWLGKPQKERWLMVVDDVNSTDVEI